MTTVLLVVAVGCASPAAHSSGGVARPATGADDLVSVEDGASVSTLSLLPHQRRWLLEVQVTLRWAYDLSDVLRHWWQGPDTAAVYRSIARAEQRVLAFARRHAAPRLATDWSPVNDAEHPLARRYDDLMRQALGTRLDAVDNLALMVQALLDDVGRGDAIHPEIALLVSTITEDLMESQLVRNTTRPS